MTGSLARYTTPMAPLPSSLRTSYRPSFVTRAPAAIRAKSPPDRRILRGMDASAPAIRGVPIVRVGRGRAERREDRVSVEEPLEIRVGGETLAVTMRTPGDDFDLAAGWLVAEGIVRRPEDLVRMEHGR